MANSRAAVSVKVGAPADQVWEHIGSFANIKAIAQGAITSCEMDKTGTIRKLKVKGAKGIITERLIKYDSQTLTQIYTIIDKPNNIVPFINYTAIIKVKASTARSSTIEWSSRFEPKKGQTADGCRDFALGIYDLAIGGVKKRLGLTKPEKKAAAKKKAPAKAKAKTKAKPAAKSAAKPAAKSKAKARAKKK